MTKLEKRISKEIEKIEKTYKLKWTLRDQERLEIHLKEWKLPEGCDHQNYQLLMGKSSNKTASSRAVAVGELTFNSKDYSTGRAPIKKEHIPYALKNYDSIKHSIERGLNTYDCIGPQRRSLSEKMPTSKIGQLAKTLLERSNYGDKSEVYYEKRTILIKRFVRGKYYYLCAISTAFEIIISNEGDLDVNPRWAGSTSLIYESEAKALDMLNRIIRNENVEEDTLPPGAYGDFATRIHSGNLDGIESIPTNFSLLVQVCVTSKKTKGPKRKDTLSQLKTRIWPILKNQRLFEVDGDLDEAASQLLEKLCLFPALKRYEKLKETGAKIRVRVIISALDFFLRHFRDEHDHLVRPWKRFKEQLEDQLHDSVDEWTKIGKLLKSSSFEILDLSMTEKLLDYLGRNRIELYHWSLLALSCGMRINEIDRFIADPLAYVIEDGFTLDCGKIISKINSTRKCEMPLVAMLIYKYLDRFPTQSFQPKDLDTRGAKTNVRNQLKENDKVNFYRRRMRTTCSTMLAKCQNEVSTLQIPVSYLSILERGGWMDEKTARDHYIKSLPNSGIMSDKYFSLRDPSSRSVHTCKEKFTEREGDKISEKQVDRQFDLLEGQNSWDAWLLRHFIQTHLHRIESDDSTDTDQRETRKIVFLDLVLSWQNALFERTGWIRKHDSMASHVITLIANGYILEAEAYLDKMVEKNYPDRLPYKRILRELAAFLEYQRSIRGKAPSENEITVEILNLVKGLVVESSPDGEETTSE